MTKLNKIKNSKFITELSENEQETLTGGRASSFGFDNFFFQRTDINSFASNDLNISSGNNNLSSSQRSGYSLSRITLGFSSLFGGGRRRRSSQAKFGNFLSFLFSMFS
ncbi:MAG: hypothetical protein IGS39_11870 [Calothrix sp. C42_A2020_038]|nr:hypothetical protein [Calothrix sp. C42_A2020_038]